jgi:hypothetical protein
VSPTGSTHAVAHALGQPAAVGASLLTGGCSSKDTTPFTGAGAVPNLCVKEVDHKPKKLACRVGR